MITMRNILITSILPLIIVSMCVSGCAGKAGKLMESAQANYQVNDYEGALRDAVSALRINPNYVKAQDFVTTFFNAAVEARKSSIKSLETSPDKFRWDQMVADYKALNEINGLVRNLPPLIHKKTKQRITFNIQEYTRELNVASENAAEVHYQEGISLAESGSDVEIQKSAAKEFRKATEFVPGYKDADDRYQQAKRAGQKRMAIFTFEDKSGKTDKYGGGLLDQITDVIIGNVQADLEASEFLEIISREQVEAVMAEQNLGFSERFDDKTVAGIGQVAGVHELVIGQITRLTYTPARTKSKSSPRKSTLRLPAGEYVDEKGKTRTRYAEKVVSATFTHYTVASSVTITGSYKILDVKTAKVNKTDRFTVTHDFSAEWGEVSGDERALSRREDIRLHSLEEQEAPLEEDMVFDAAEKLSAELSKKLIEYAR